MAMEWTTGSGSSCIGVIVPDDLALALVDAVDVPRGSTSIDLYRNSEHRGMDLVSLRNNVVHAAEMRRSLVRSEILDQLHRAQVEGWMTNMIETRERSDRMLSMLEELKALLDLAVQENAIVYIHGD